MKSNEFKWHQKSSREIKWIHMASKKFTWKEKNSNEIKFTRTQMNSNEICKKYRKMWISEKNVKKKLAKFAKICITYATDLHQFAMSLHQFAINLHEFAINV